MRTRKAMVVDASAKRGLKRRWDEFRGVIAQHPWNYRVYSSLKEI